ncbi:hypothetical protein VMCG_04495 [Cytospora schulzeri]|uniref:Hemerythrin-like domain-containing protein n=1 Tax=Cytospora schulzeri TaxID=448051 RepID=A0A423WRL0_9PEZI|nr:hypothetical protein VMCG_04495 [Valsa malicola]
MSTPTSSPDRERVGVRYVSDAVKRDHRTLEKLYTTLGGGGGGDSPPPDPELQRELQQRLCWELARHLVAMNLFIFPGTTRRASQGNQNAKDRQADLARLRERMLDFRAVRVSPDPSSADGDVDVNGDGGEGGGEDEFRGALSRLREDLARHIRDVERTDMVAIEKMLSGEESERLASDFGATVFFIPPEVRGGPEGGEGVRAPFGSIDELLDASAGELLGVLEGFPRE